MKLRTSAKINLNLEIFSEKQDSLHKLSSLMIPIDIYDDIEIEESISENIKFSDGNLNNIESTIHKALKLIRKNNPSFDKSFDIYIDKKIPYNSGLGGGSSDAGALIRYLCDNYELDLPSNLEIVREVGSDVPFFVKGVSAVIQGIGEIVEPLELNNLIKEIRLLEDTLGNYEKKPYKEELLNIRFARKYIIAKNKIRKGEKFSNKNLTTKRSGVGIPSEKWDFIIGKKSKFNFWKKSLSNYLYVHFLISEGKLGC